MGKEQVEICFLGTGNAWGIPEIGCECRICNRRRELKKKTSPDSNPSLDVNKLLITLASVSLTNPAVEACLDKLHLLKDCEMHSTHLPSQGDEKGIRELGINLTTDSELTPKIHLTS
jgi:uncharacterized protein (UPF0371 family)